MEQTNEHKTIAKSKDFLSESITPELNPEQAREKYLFDLWHKGRVKNTVPEAKSPIAWGMQHPETGEVLAMGTLGNLTMVKGRAKSRKSFLIGLCAAVVLKQELLYNLLISDLPEDKRGLIYFDTEQDRGDLWAAVNRVCRLAGKDGDPENLDVVSITEYSLKDRLDVIKLAIENTPNLGLVVIDGVVDICKDIMHYESCAELADDLRRISVRYNVNIVCVLHQNKSDRNGRGHIGTELTNKASVIMDIEKDKSDKNRSIVTPDMCRGKDFEPFAFRIDNNGIPVIDEFSVCFAPTERKPTERKQTVKDRVNKLTKSDKYKLLLDVYKNGSEFGYKQLEIQLQIAFKNIYGEHLPGNLATTLYTMCKNDGLISQDGARKPYTLNEYFP